MKTISLLFASLFLLSLFPESLLAQRGSFVETNDYRRFALSIGMGRTQGFDQYEVLGRDHPDMNFFNPRETNIAFGFTWYHRERWFTSFHLHGFNSMSGMSAGRTIPATDSTAESFRTRSSAQGFIFNDYSIRFGRTNFARYSGWQASWMVGMNFKHLSHDASSRSTRLVQNTLLEIRHRSTDIRPSGFIPSLQVGLQVAHRGPKMGLSLMLLGNYGLRYFATDEYEVWIDNEQYRAAIRTKNDLIAWVLQYEVYFGNTSRRR
ncbi:MAG: hypothetical protein AAGI23_18305 [Bacteroidota bacterium]